MSKVVNLSVHKNTKDQRRAKERRKDLVGAAKHQAQTMQDIDGYCLVTWDSDGEAKTSWQCGHLETSVLPSYVKTTVQRAIGIRDNE